MKSKAMDKGTVWASYWAALVHDYEHGGFNNDFLIKTAQCVAVHAVLCSAGCRRCALHALLCSAGCICGLIPFVDVLDGCAT